MQLLQLHNLSKSYPLESGQVPVLKKISFEVKSGELLAIVGASGSGKSTLMTILGLLEKADSGEYRLKQQNTAQLTADYLAHLRKHHIGFVFQQFNLLPRFTALQNVALPLFYRAMSAKEAEEISLAALDQVGMASFAHHRPTQLSGGQQQRVAVARAIIGSPELILADEPTGALDSNTGAQLMSLFLQLHTKNHTLIIVTHDEKIARRCARCISLADGEIIDDRYQ